VGSQGRRHRRFRQCLHALQPKGQLQEFHLSGRNLHQRQRHFRTPADPNGDFSKGYECQINATHGDPIKTGSLYTMVHLDKAAHGPDEFYTEEVEVQDVMYRGKPITRIKVRVNGKLLYEFQDFAPAWKEGHFGFQQHDPGSVVKIRKIEVKELPSGVK
jgi:hypothetical protein